MVCSGACVAQDRILERKRAERLDRPCAKGPKGNERFREGQREVPNIVGEPGGES